MIDQIAADDALRADDQRNLLFCHRMSLLLAKGKRTGLSRFRQMDVQ